MFRVDVGPDAVNAMIFYVFDTFTPELRSPASIRMLFFGLWIRIA